VNGAFEAYTRAVLAFRLGEGSGGYPTVQASAAALEPIARRAAGADHCVLLGVGRGEAAAALAAGLAPGTGFTVLETDPAQALAHGRGLPLLADASPVALAWLLRLAGLHRPGTFLALNPEVACPATRERLRAAQRLHAAFEPLALDGARGPASLSVAAILHPDEPDLEGFFAHLPPSACEVVALWDAQEPPDAVPPCPVPVRHLAHPLGSDFAAQRNRMLAACRGDWVLTLDADERLPETLAGLLPALTGQGACAAFAFERRTLCPQGVRVGYGLWPDLQLRLFRRGPGLRFARPVHERLEGLEGPTGLLPGLAIRHLSGLLKDERALAAKHALFDRAGGPGVAHRLSGEYPALPEAFFRVFGQGQAPCLWPGHVAFAPL